jgi:cytochrome c peroxidase
MGLHVHAMARTVRSTPLRIVCGLALAGFGLTAAPASRAPAARSALSPAADAGRLMFFDPSLSASGRIACATCHDPAHAYASPNGLAVQPGGPALQAAGIRAVPSLRYLEYTPPYSDQLDNPERMIPPGPGGGFTRDGRASTLADQTEIPLLSPYEMANADAAAVVARIASGAYADRFRLAFGAAVFDDRAAAFDRAKGALQAFQLEDESFHPYSSKYDRYASGEMGGALSAAELRGMKIFNDPAKGNCAACHYSGSEPDGALRMFTSYTFSAIGVPRNPDIPANRDRAYFDLGLCGRADHPLPASARYCGMFKTPSLRNAAARRVFFHNGQIKSLRDAIRFYNTRDTRPENWYPTVNGVVQKFDDLPFEYQQNLDRQAPLDGRRPGDPPAMTDRDLDDLESFLNALVDDDLVPTSSAARRPAALLSFVRR